VQENQFLETRARNAAGSPALRLCPRVHAGLKGANGSF
jgi:hypothetical protein